MATWEDVHREALGLPEAEERISRGNRQWRVGGKLFVWERPLRPGEIEELGHDAPDGPILGARVEHDAAKQALIADEPAIYFTTSHFDGHASILVRLERIPIEDLRELITEAWVARAPGRARDRYFKQRTIAPQDASE